MTALEAYKALPFDFVFANPSKKSISIQAFEKDRMKDLASEMDEEA